MRAILAFTITLVAALSVQAVNIDTVLVGNPSNAEDSTGFGSVGYAYRISTYEVTNSQYVEFLNSVDPVGTNVLGLYSSSMTSDARGGISVDFAATIGSRYALKPGRANNPVVFVSWYDAIRFTNWLHNGQEGGSTELGAYTILGGTPTPLDGSSITRNTGARWFLPNEDEWYKAAYYDPRNSLQDGPPGDDHYWRYTTLVDNAAEVYSDNPNSVNSPNPNSTINILKSDGIANGYDDGFAVTGLGFYEDDVNYLTDVGAYGLATGYYGTFDQGGNVWEWTESLRGGTSSRAIRGSGFGDTLFWVDAYQMTQFVPTRQSEMFGFRVAAIVPEPPTSLLVLAAQYLLSACRRKSVLQDRV